MPQVSEKQFSDVLEAKLPVFWDRALAVFRNYGVWLSWDVTNVLLHAADQGKVNEVLKILEEHYLSHLYFQHPDFRGVVGRELLGINETQVLFEAILTRTLGLQPSVV